MGWTESVYDKQRSVAQLVSKMIRETFPKILEDEGLVELAERLRGLPSIDNEDTAREAIEMLISHKNDDSPNVFMDRKYVGRISNARRVARALDALSDLAESYSCNDTSQIQTLSQLAASSAQAIPSAVVFKETK